MFAKLSVIFAVVLLAAAALANSGQSALADSPPPTGPAKVLTLNPTSGVVGTVVTGELFNAPPNDFITVIFKIPGDPVLTTGTTDANGYLKVTFTVPYVPGGGTYPVFFTDFKCSCQIAADFTVINSRPTPTPTATPTTPPGATPTRTPTQPPSTATALPTSTPSPTPGVPVLGTTPSGGGPGPNMGVLALGFLSVLVVLSWFAATRRGPSAPALARVNPEDPGPDYSTELDLPTLDSFRRSSARPGRSSGRRHGLAWAATAAGALVAGVFLFRQK